MFASFFQNKFRKNPAGITSDISGNNISEVNSITVSDHNEYNTIVGSTHSVESITVNDHNEYTTITGSTHSIDLSMGTDQMYTTITGSTFSVPLSIVG